MYKAHIVGKTGEDIATEYLLKNGYNIIERNFYCKIGEIDIIALKNKYNVKLLRFPLANEMLKEHF